MLRNTNDLKGYAIHATDGIIGHVEDFYFDDEAWVIRYLVVDTGSWLSSRKVLISPMAIDRANWQEKSLSASLTRMQVEKSPAVDTDKPVSKQYEMEHLRYYGYPFYWDGFGMWGQAAFPGMLAFPGMSPMSAGNAGVRHGSMDAQDREVRAMVESERHRNDDPHLRSCTAVLNYHIQATDGEIGHVQGFLIDDESWAVRYLVVDTNNWWLDHEVLVVPQWIKDVSWLDATVMVDLTKEAVKTSPHYDSAAQLTREQEKAVYLHYGRTGYWSAEKKSEALIARI